MAYGTKMADAVAPVSLMASATLAKTGLPRCSLPAFLGFVPPTTLVPVCACQWLLLLLLLPRSGQQEGASWHAYRIRLPAGRGSCCASAAWVPLCARRGIHSRPLLAGEALEEHLCVAVDAQVLDRLGVLRGARRILPGGASGERRAQRESEGLHRDGEVATNAELDVRRGVAAVLLSLFAACVERAQSCDAAALLRLELCRQSKFLPTPQSDQRPQPLRPRPTTPSVPCLANLG